MSDSAGVLPALGIEAVEWLSDGGENLTVRVTGRWHRRRPTWSGQPLLVIEAQGRWHRFPAIPDHSGLTGTAPGTWRMSFSVAGSLAPHIGSRGWLQLGAVVVPLPIEVRPAIPPGPTDPETVATLRAETVESAVDAALRRAAEAEETATALALRTHQLDGELARALSESTRLERLHAAVERTALAAAQREHAERTRREELHGELARLRRRHERAQAAVAQRIVRLQSEVARLTRRGDEADHAARVARSARARAERELGELKRSIAADEQRLPGGEREPVAARSPRPKAASEAVSEPAGPSDTAAGPVDEARLGAALSRLREATPEPSPEVVAERSGAATPVRPWLAQVFREMVKRDPGAAGRLAVALLPAQPLVHPRPLAYDLVLSELGCVAVTATNGQARVEMRDSARSVEQTQLVVTGELGGLGRLLGARRMRRRVRHGQARVKGERSALRALRSLVRAQLSLEQLHAAGFRPEPSIALRLVSLMLRPELTRREDFMIAHQDQGAAAPGAALRVCDKATVSVGDAVELRPGCTTVVCPAGSLLAVLSGAADAAAIEGDARPLALLRDWLMRAQSV